MKIPIDDYRVDEDTDVKLTKWPTSVKHYYRSKSEYEQILATHVDRLRTLQPLLYAHNRYALLIIFQAMDAAGKDGAIKHVMSGVNPQGTQPIGPALFARPVRRGGRGAKAQACRQHVAASLARSQCA